MVCLRVRYVRVRPLLTGERPYCIVSSRVWGGLMWRLGSFAMFLDQYVLKSRTYMEFVRYGAKRGVFPTPNAKLRDKDCSISRAIRADGFGLCGPYSPNRFWLGRTRFWVWPNSPLAWRLIPPRRFIYGDVRKLMQSYHLVSGDA